MFSDDIGLPYLHDSTDYFAKGLNWWKIVKFKAVFTRRCLLDTVFTQKRRSLILDMLFVYTYPMKLIADTQCIR